MWSTTLKKAEEIKVKVSADIELQVVFDGTHTRLQINAPLNVKIEKVTVQTPEPAFVKGN